MDPTFTTKEGVAALLNQEQKGNLARRIQNRAALRQRLEVVDAFAEVRGALGHAFRGETFYGPSIHDES